jgi:acetylornithine deacetylase/succinyl-diaminopimelate desuccinylase-like protein
MSTIESGQTTADMKAILAASPDKTAIDRLSENAEYNAIMRTTCIATRLSAGHANNALPQSAQANVNCRILPGHSLEEVRQDLARIFDDTKITVRYVDNAGEVHDSAPAHKALPPAALKPEVMQPLEKLVDEMWPGIPVIPTMATGASDGVFTNAAGMPTYGICGIALETNDVRAHGKDERVPIDSYYKGVEFYYQFVKLLSSSK